MQRAHVQLAGHHCPHTFLKVMLIGRFLCKYTIPSPHCRYAWSLWVWLEKELKPHKKLGLCSGPTSVCPFLLKGSLSKETDVLIHSSYLHVLILREL